jgi:hypothetical protein
LSLPSGRHGQTNNERPWSKEDIEPTVRPDAAESSKREILTKGIVLIQPLK